MSCHIDYYVRVFVRVYSSAAMMKEASSKTSLVYQCHACKSFETQPIGKFIKTEKGSKYGPATINVNSNCTICGGKVQIGGPFYSHPIHNSQFVSKMIGEIAFNHSKYGTWERMIGMTKMIQEEMDTPLYYVLSKMCAVLHCSSPALSIFMYI
jgi:tRNA (guanine26-N2/guanine27-N2)-dimethyltransferase